MVKADFVVSASSSVRLKDLFWPKPKRINHFFVLEETDTPKLKNNSCFGQNRYTETETTITIKSEVRK